MWGQDLIFECWLPKGSLGTRPAVSSWRIVRRKLMILRTWSMDSALVLFGDVQLSIFVSFTSCIVKKHREMGGACCELYTIYKSWRLIFPQKSKTVSYFSSIFERIMSVE